jgi:hypothetical protein
MPAVHWAKLNLKLATVNAVSIHYLPSTSVILTLPAISKRSLDPCRLSTRIRAYLDTKLPTKE